MAVTQVIKTICGICLESCGVLVTVKDGKPVEIKGDPENPFSQGLLCKKGRASLEYFYHPDRLMHPLRRVGKRGEGKWQHVSWEEAFTIAGSALNRVKQEYGPEAVLMAHGSAKGSQDTHVVRLANAFGTPNFVCADHVCHVPRMLAAEITFGFWPAGDFAYNPACILLWGGNPAATNPVMHSNIVKAQGKGTKLIVINPLQATEIANTVDLWLQVRPGSDLAPALGMINVIVGEGLYDKDFVAKCTVGFDRLARHVQDYSPERVAEISWVPAAQIKEAARLYASSKPAHIQWGNALDHNVNSFQSARALSILMAITGNLGVPGGAMKTLNSGFRFNDPYQPSVGIQGRWSSEFELRDNIPRERRRNKVGVELTGLPDFRYTTPQAIIKAVLEGSPYYIRAAYIQASNPLSCWCNSQETYRALQKLDFLAVTDMFMTATAAMADIVFPAATYLEYDGVIVPLPGPPRFLLQRKIGQIGECRSDHEIIIGLAKKLGLAEYFWNSIDDFWDFTLRDVGLTFNEFRRMGYFKPDIKQPVELNKPKQNDFNTPSGKVELYSSQLEECGLDPLPIYYEPPETSYSDAKLTKEYPLLCTTRKLDVYRHSGGRQIESLRNSRPDPVVIIHPETAGKLSINDGDWVYVENKRGRIKQKANVSADVDPRVVVADYAWWFPERGAAELFAWAESNYNVLTNDKPPFNREMGSFNIRGIACRVYKIT
jgi:anaerobic selenocysteine-containing dehydrogenase